MKALSLVVLSLVANSAQAAILCTGKDPVTQHPVNLYLENGVASEIDQIPSQTAQKIFKGTIFAHPHYFPYGTGNGSFTIPYAFQNPTTGGCYSGAEAQSAVITFKEFASAQPISYAKFKLNYWFGMPKTRCAGGAKLVSAELDLVSAYDPKTSIKVKLTCQQ